MDNSLSNFELTESTMNIATDSENGSDKSDTIVDLEYVSSTSNKSEEDFDSNLPDTVTVLRHEPTGTKVYLIGTVHFSRESQADVIKVIENVEPSVVVLELCSARTNILSLDEEQVLEEAKNIDMQKIITTIRTSGTYNGIMYLLLLSMSAHLTKETGMAPGGEFRVAYREAMKLNCGVHLGDRPIDITLKRALSRLSWYQTLKLGWHMLTSKDPVSLEDIEQCKNRDMLEQLLTELSGEYPAFREVFLDERDIYLANSIQVACTPKKGHPKPKTVVGVVGIGHVPGITRLWPHSQQAYVKDILTVPPPSVSSIVLSYSFKVCLLAGGGYLFYKCVPVPRFLKENVHLLVHKVVSGVNIGNKLKYGIH